MHGSYFPFGKVVFLKAKPLAKMNHQELLCLEKLHWTVFPFHLCFSGFFLICLFILAFVPFQNGGGKKKGELCVTWKIWLLPTYAIKEVVDWLEAMATLSSFQRQYIK